MLDRYRAEFKPVGKITEDVKTYLGNFGYPKTAVHCIAVAKEAKSLAARFQDNPFQAEQQLIIRTGKSAKNKRPSQQ